MYYVYTVSIDGLIFYIGMTGNPVNRYLMHYNDSMSRPYQAVRYLLLEGKVCTMELLHTSDNKNRILNIEANYIRAYDKTHFLLNTAPSDYFRYLIPYSEIKKLPFQITKKLKDSINSIRQQQLILNELWNK